MITIFKDSDNVIELKDLKNSVTDTLDLAATVQATLMEKNGTPVPGQAWPLTMTHAGGGLYRGIIEDTVQIFVHKQYILEIDADGSGSEDGLWREEVEVAYKSTTP